MTRQPFKSAVVWSLTYTSAVGTSLYRLKALWIRSIRWVPVDGVDNSDRRFIHTEVLVLL
eukprot:858956-Amphidinium_carterae.1